MRARGGWNRVECFSPDGRWLAVVRLDGSYAISDDLLLVDLETGDVRTVVARMDRAPRWLQPGIPNSSGFLFSTDAGRDVASIARYDIGTLDWRYVLETAWDSEATPQPRRAKRPRLPCRGCDHPPATAGRYQPRACPGHPVARPGNGFRPAAGSPAISLPRRRDRAAQLYDDGHPDDTRCASTSVKAPRFRCCRWTRWSPAELVAPELQKIASFDGEPITYFLYRPAVDNPPVVMVVHGGPEARFAPRYDPFIIRLVADGIAVVAPNVRGSAGWGRRFVSLDDRRLRLNSVRDLTAVHASLAEQGSTRRGSPSSAHRTAAT